ncbi:MAG: XRE family transcriptional regulator, partial [Gemmatimonadetes bacterium]|nr:XRE family transcriptional regulator [Gemmatimonadota bacterium]
AHVTDSYISQLLTGKKTPPAPNRTDIYEKMDKFLKLPRGELATLADQQRKEQLKKALGNDPTPLFREVRALVLRKCDLRTERHIRAIFEKQPFGELERLVTQKLLDVVKGLAQRELENESWLRTVAELGGRNYEEMRVIVLDFLDTDIFHVSSEHCVAFLDPLIDSWAIDLATFALDIVLTDKVVSGNVKRFEFVEVESPQQHVVEEPGLKTFLQDPALSGTATAEEIESLRHLKFKGKRPTPLYYYRELQSRRDPLHFALPRPK